QHQRNDLNDVVDARLIGPQKPREAAVQNRLPLQRPTLVPRRLRFLLEVLSKGHHLAGHTRCVKIVNRQPRIGRQKCVSQNHIPAARRFDQRRGAGGDVSPHNQNKLFQSRPVRKTVLPRDCMVRGLSRLEFTLLKSVLHFVQERAKIGLFRQFTPFFTGIAHLDRLDIAWLGSDHRYLPTQNAIDLYRPPCEHSWATFPDSGLQKEKGNQCDFPNHWRRYAFASPSPCSLSDQFALRRPFPPSANA